MSWTSKSGPVDVLGELVVNFLGTSMAARNPTLRTTVGGADTPFLDYRFLGGVVATGIGWGMGDGWGRRILYDGGAGLLHSFIGTETVRAASMSRLQSGGATKQIPDAAPWGQPQFAPPVDPGVQRTPERVEVRHKGPLESMLPGLFR